MVVVLAMIVVIAAGAAVLWQRGGGRSDEIAIPWPSTEAIVTSELATVTIENSALHFRSSARHQWFELPVDVDASVVNVLELEWSVEEGGTHHAPRLQWKREGEAFDTARELAFPPRPPGASSTVRLHVEAHPEWSGRITALRFFPTDLAGEVAIDAARFRTLTLPVILEGDGAEGDAIEYYPIGPETRAVRYVPVSERDSRSFVIRGNRELRYAVGVPEYVWKNVEGPIIFRVAIEGSARREELDRVVLDGNAREEDRAWVDRAVTIPELYGDEVVLWFDTHMETSPATEIPAFFAHPLFALDPSHERPNVLLVSLDTLRADHLGLQGYPRGTSPVLDRLAKDCAVFTNARSPAAKTLPSHMSLFTGLNASVHEIIDQTDMLAKGWPMWAGIVRESGAYHTAAFTEDAFVSAIFGFRYGFHRYHDGTFHLLEAEEFTKGGDVDVTFARGRAFIEANRERPWFLFLHTYEPHSPYCPPEPWDGMYRDVSHRSWVGECIQDTTLKSISKRRVEFDAADLEYIIAAYDEEIRYTDAMLGEVIATLEATGQWDDTLLVVFSDHGEDFDDHRDVGRHGHQTYDSVVHVPLLIRWPKGGVRPGVHTTDVSLVDIGPTVLDLLGMDVPDVLQGRSLAAAARGGELEPSPTVSSNLSLFMRKAIVLDGWKFIANLGWNDAKVVASKIPPIEADIFGGRDVELELYDLRSDPAELVNVADQYPDVVQRFKKLFATMERENIATQKLGPKKVQPTGVGQNYLKKLKDLGYIEDDDADGTPPGEAQPDTPDGAADE